MFLVHSREESNGRIWSWQATQRELTAGGKAPNDVIPNPVRFLNRVRNLISFPVSAKSRSFTRKRRRFGMTLFLLCGRGERATMDFPSFELKGQVALVTGAARGLGRAISLALAHAEAD